MSGLYALALIGGWLAISWFLIWSWKLTRPFTTWPRRIHLVFGFLVLGSWFAWSFWEAEGRKLYWDYQVWQMCQEDGGVKVYETVEVPKGSLDKYGRFNVPDVRNVQPSDEYFFVNNVYFIRKGWPKVLRDVTKIVRRSDKVVLGKSVRYGRSGGGVRGPWHPSSYSCPDVMDLRIESEVFMEENSDE